ncbi:MAG: hypothetical protein EOP20_10555, partial [Hyphomicrobiales bacterium]
MPKTFFRIGLTAALGAALALMPLTHVAASPARIKDIVDVEGIRENQLVGYGLVVGLNGTGDSLNNSPFTKQSLQSMLERLGVNTAGENVRTANVAAVIVTATLPPFAAQGSRMDVSVSALGDSDSLQGGTLLVTPLVGADGEVFAIAQGPVTINGFKAEGDAASIVSGVPTTGRISSGALIEREIGFELGSQHTLRLSLRNPDLTTARRVAMAVNDGLVVATEQPHDAMEVQGANDRKQLYRMGAVTQEMFYTLRAYGLWLNNFGHVGRNDDYEEGVEIIHVHLSKAPLA